jgi:hypothetical protein
MILKSIGGSVTMGNLFISARVFSLIGIAGAGLVVNSSHTKVAGWLMIIAAIGIVYTSVIIGVFGPFYYFMIGILLIIAGLMSAFKNTKA